MSDENNGIQRNIRYLSREGEHVESEGNTTTSTPKPPTKVLTRIMCMLTMFILPAILTVPLEVIVNTMGNQEQFSLWGILLGVLWLVFSFTYTLKVLFTFRKKYHKSNGVSEQELIKQDKGLQAFAPFFILLIIFMVGMLSGLGLAFKIIAFTILMVFVIVNVDKKLFNKFTRKVDEIANKLDRDVFDNLHYTDNEPNQNDIRGFNVSADFKRLQDKLNMIIITNKAPNEPKRLYEFLNFDESNRKYYACDFGDGDDVEITEVLTISEIKSYDRLPAHKKAMLDYAKRAIPIEALKEIGDYIDEICDLEDEIAYRQEYTKYAERFSENLDGEKGGLENIIQQAEGKSQKLNEYLKENQIAINESVSNIQTILNQHINKQSTDDNTQSDDEEKE